MSTEKNNLMEKIVSLCKRRGFVYPASEIYGGFANAFDYGPLGTQMKKNIKDAWWKRFVNEREDIVGLDSAIIQNPKIWEASGHLAAFTDPLVECKKCHQRFREDHANAAHGHFEEAAAEADEKSRYTTGSLASLGMTPDAIKMVICPQGGEHEFTAAKEFNLMFKTFIGVTEDSASVAYLRPETAQGIFANFQNVLQSSRIKPPFGIAQIGKAFRNEITPGNFTFRTREFEQAEIEYFIQPNAAESEKHYRYWVDQVKQFYLDLGIGEANLTIREHEKDELSHYSSGTSDIEYEFPFGISELAGIAQRTDYDLRQHQEVSGQDLRYFDEERGEKYIPYVVEPSMGIDRAMLALLVDAYDESDGTDGRAAGEVTLRLHPKVAPIKVGVFPLIKKEGLPEIARKIAQELRQAGIATFYDESGSVGRRYRRQDEIGTPWCITVDFDTIKDDTVTLRDRDSMKQDRVKMDELVSLITSNLR